MAVCESHPNPDSDFVAVDDNELPCLEFAGLRRRDAATLILASATTVFMTRTT